MKYPKLHKLFLLLTGDRNVLTPKDLVKRLERKLNRGDVFAALEILGQLDRPLSLSQRVAMIQGCLAQRKYAKALYLARRLPNTTEKAEFLTRITKEAAFADDYATARHAALLCEQLKLQANPAIK